MVFFAQLHPILVPFAVALLVMGVVFEYYGKLQSEESARTAGGLNIRLGLAFGIAAVIVGFLGVIGIGDIFSEADPRVSPEVKVHMRKFLSYHVLFASSTVLIFILALITARYCKKKWGQALYFTLLGVGLASVLATGYFGGELVHRFGLPAPTPTQ
ncbi:MAG: hypothetical protein OEY26_02605 [Nitrospinota bacterium]|nr:hypothetical protein [Nitrospinota bacterium]